MIIFRALHSEVQKCNFLKITSSALSTSSFKWQKMFVNSKEMQAFRAFLSQLRRFLSAPLPCIVAALHSRGLARRPGGSGGLQRVRSAHAGIHPGAHRHLWLWVRPTSSPVGICTGQAAEAASAEGVASCWPRGVNWLLILH